MVVVGDQPTVILGLRLIAKGLPSKISTQEAQQMLAMFEAMEGEIQRLNEVLSITTKTIEERADDKMNAETIALTPRKPAPPTVRFRQKMREITHKADCPKCTAQFASPGDKPSGQFCPVCPDRTDPGLLVWEPI